MEQAIAFVDWISAGGSDGRLTSFRGFWSVVGGEKPDWITTKELWEHYQNFLNTPQEQL